MSSSVPALAISSARDDRYSATLVGVARAEEVHGTLDGVEIRRLEYKGIRPIADWQVYEQIRQLGVNAEIIHIHGVWERHCASVGLLSRNRSTPYVVSAHGMLEPWALQHKRWKKALYSSLVERPNLNQAAFLRALTTSEMEDYRQFGLGAPMGIIPNGVTIPAGVDATRFLREFPDLSGKRLMLFLSRLHPKKGMDQFLDAWARISKQFPDWHVVVAGPDFVGTRQALEHQARELLIDNRVSFTGLLTGDLKWGALAAAEIFILPSHSEGFSMAVLEALGVGTPVLITVGCKFPEVATEGCGWVSEPTSSALERDLRSILPLGNRELAAMGTRGAKLVAHRYSWEVIGKQIADVYDWLLGGPIPSSVEVVGSR